MPYPASPELDGALFRFILIRGGADHRVAARSVYGPLADLFQLRDYERVAPRKGGHRGREWNTRVRLARQRLVKKGLLAPHGADKGYWTLTPKGVQLANEVITAGGRADFGLEP